MRIFFLDNGTSQNKNIHVSTSLCIRALIGEL